MGEKETKKYDCKYGSDEKSLKDSIRAWVSISVQNEEMVAEMDEDVCKNQVSGYVLQCMETMTVE